MTALPKRSGVSELGRRYLELIHESPHYIAVSKPAYTLCQDERQNPASLSNWMRDKFPNLFTMKQHPFHAPKGVHRLDALVTGCVLYGTSTHGTKQLAKSFKKRKVDKGYLALLDRSDTDDDDDDTSPLTRGDSGTIVSLDRCTEWTVLARLKEQTSFTRTTVLCWLRPLEGRNHQLRIHAAEDLGAPILFDRLYAQRSAGSHRSSSSGVDKSIYKQEEGEGIALHCASLAFPLGLERQRVSCLPPPFGIWRHIAERHGIDWQRVVDAGATYRHASSGD